MNPTIHSLPALVREKSFPFTKQLGISHIRLVEYRVNPIWDNEYKYQDYQRRIVVALAKGLIGIIPFNGVCDII